PAADELGWEAGPNEFAVASAIPARPDRLSTLAAVKGGVLNTSYPRSPEDVVGRFVADAVDHVRARGVTVEVVSPLSFHHFGIAYGYGVVGNLRRRPWLAAALPAMLF